MKKVLLISSVIPDECKDIVMAPCVGGNGLNVPTNVFQLSIIDGLWKNNIDTEILSAPSLPAFPRYKLLRIPYCNGKINKGVSYEVIPYNTFFLWKYASIEKILKKKIVQWIENNIEKEIAVLVYSENPAFVAAIRYVKQAYPKVKTSIIVTDMIEDADNFLANRKFLKRIQLAIHKKKIKNGINSFDYYILLTELMKQRISNCKTYCIVEGLYKERDSCSDNYSGDKEKVIFYSGALDSYVNIQELIDAYILLDQNDYELVICGGGPLSNYVKDISLKHDKIRYLGVLPREEVLKWQKKSSFLINPRQPSEITKFSFPSKIIEYFASGTPVIMYRLEGIPDEYYEYCYEIHGTTVNEIANSLQRIISIPEVQYNEIGIKAKNFIMKNKTSKKQVAKILDLIFESKMY